MQIHTPKQKKTFGWPKLIHKFYTLYFIHSQTRIRPVYTLEANPLHDIMFSTKKTEEQVFYLGTDKKLLLKLYMPFRAGRLGGVVGSKQKKPLRKIIFFSFLLDNIF